MARLLSIKFERAAASVSATNFTGNLPEEAVIPPFLRGSSRRIHAAVFSFIAGVIPPMPMLGRSLLYVHSHSVA